jgi:hypothetical protein
MAEPLPPRDDFRNLVPVRSERLAKQTVSAATNTYTFKTFKIVDNGSSGNRVNVAYASEAYTVSQLAQFPAVVDSAIKYRRQFSLLARPLPRYYKFCNFYRIDLESPQSGLNVVSAWGGPIITSVNNALGGTRDQDRLGWVDFAKAADFFSQAATRAGTTFHWKNVVLNDPGYYNSGSEYVVFAKNYWGEIALHEGGHGFHQLADEYYGPGSDYAEYGEINSTADPQSPKWAHWAGYLDDDYRLGTMGYYEGSRYVTSGQYRPSLNSKMGWVPASYNAISREKIIHDIYAIVHPIDSMLDTAVTLKDPIRLWVSVIDTSVLKVDWFVDGTLVKKNGGTSFPKASISVSPGLHQVRAHVYDEIIRHSKSNNNDPDSLDLVRLDTTRLVQDVQWKVELSPGTVAFQPWVDKVASLPALESYRGPVRVRQLSGAVMGNREWLGLRHFSHSSGLPPGLYFLSVPGKATQVYQILVR